MQSLIYSIYRAIFASIFLKEKLGPIGKIGCLLSVVGALIIVLHAPEDKEVTSIDELLFYALRPGNIYICILKGRGNIFIDSFFFFKKKGL